MLRPRPVPAAAIAFRDHIAVGLGFRIEDDRLPELEELLRLRVAETRARTVDEYLSVAENSSAEQAAISRALSVSETYFLRNRNHFSALRAILARREDAGGRHLRVLSAGCSTGEEAYSVAITLLETVRTPLEWTLSVLGVDLNPQSIDLARQGNYRAWSLRDTPPTIRDRYFQASERGYAVIDEVRRHVRFEQRNLLDWEHGLWKRETFDVVLCRNVLMYLTRPAARRVVDGIALSLAQGGHLFLGHAENLRGLSQDFRLIHAHETFYYERRDAGSHDSMSTVEAEHYDQSASRDDAVPNWDWFEAIGQSSRRVERLSRESRSLGQLANASELGKVESANIPPSHTAALEEEEEEERESAEYEAAMVLMQQERFQEGLRLLARASAPSDAPETVLLHSMLLVGSGDFVEAERRCLHLLARDDLNAGAHYAKALCDEQRGDLAGAARHSQIAVYLDSGFAMPHVQLGRLARRRNDLTTARRELDLALELLATEDDARIILFGGAFGREGLRALCQAERDACVENE